jgi:hypothetical protein
LAPARPFPKPTFLRIESIPRPHHPEPMLSVALSTAAATRVVLVIKGTFSAAEAAGTKRTKAKAQRASIGGHDTHLIAFAKRFLPHLGKKLGPAKLSKSSVSASKR